MVICYLSLGSNLNSPVRQLQQAVAALARQKNLAITHMSPIYRSRPQGIKAQPPYRNMVLALKTTLSPLRLLRICQSIENQQHRLRKTHWGARTIDIDLLLCGSLTMHTPELILPHPHMLTRDFVLIPLLDIAPKLRLPNGQNITQHAKKCLFFLL